MDEIGDLAGTVNDTFDKIDAQAAEVRKLALVAERTQNAVVLAGAKRTIEWVNEGFTKLTGFVFEDVRDKDLGSWLTLRDVSDSAQRIIEVLATAGWIRSEMACPTKTGATCWVELEIQPIKNDRGDISGFVCVLADVTERRVAAETLHRRYADLEARVEPMAAENAHLNRSLEDQVRALEARNQEVQQLNNELRRQIAQRSRRLMDSLLPNHSESVEGTSFEPDSLLGDCYRVIRQLGEGGMGVVYEVERTTDQVHLAAKVLNHSPNQTDIGRFAREAQILASLSHPNLISIYDIDVTDSGVLYIVMELVAGTTLRNVPGRTGDVSWILDVLVQVVKALTELHKQAIVHRDLKPENILVVASGPDGRPLVKLADFGISIINDEPRPTAPSAHVDDTPQDSIHTPVSTTDRRLHLTQTGAFVGTPYYMAPELGEGSRNAHPAADLFALGVLTFELLTGKKPYALPPILGGVIADDVAQTLEQCPGFSARWADLFARCLDFDPQRRPTAAEISASLEQPDLGT